LYFCIIKVSSQGVVDKHVVKMILESVQLLSTAFIFVVHERENIHESSVGPRATHELHVAWPLDHFQRIHVQIQEGT